ncbi:MAG TPA: DUF268 domain-containing protein [Nitrospiraceae bacterium]|nr:DUF268 domain-containing protein [Nitrospiraceae bacterium]
MTTAFKLLVRRWVLPFANPRQLVAIGSLPRFLIDFSRYRSFASGESVAWGDTYPCLSDRLAQTPFDPHYFYQAAWLARRIREVSAPWHIDVGSSVMMVNVLSAITKTVFVDYRPLRVQLSHLHPIAGDITRLPFADASIPSLSCLHVLEHVGLGRYGDPLDPQGSTKGASELQRVLKPGGQLYLSVPVGRQKVYFNAHRVFAPRAIQSFVPALRLKSFSLVDDAGRFNEQVSLESASGLDYGCGMFEFVKARE